MVTPHTTVTLAPSVAPWRTVVAHPHPGGHGEADPRPQVVGEGDPRADEDLVADLDAVPDQTGVLDGDPIAEAGAALDEDVIADVAVGPDLCAGEQVGERPDPGPGPDLVGLLQSAAGCTCTVGSRAIV